MNEMWNLRAHHQPKTWMRFWKIKSMVYKESLPWCITTLYNKVSIYQNIKILFTEPLHDISSHIKNLYQEIPYHVPKNKKKDVRRILDISFNGKDAKNSSDYRKSLLIVAKWFSDNLPEHFFNKILLSMCNIQAINYYSEKKRSLQSILRLYPTTFQHALTIKTSLLSNYQRFHCTKIFWVILPLNCQKLSFSIQIILRMHT